jgi:hypothetical protein
VTIRGIFPYTYDYFGIPRDNSQIAGKIDNYFIFRKLKELSQLDPEPVALSTELQARVRTILPYRGADVNRRGQVTIWSQWPATA